MSWVCRSASEGCSNCGDGDAACAGSADDGGDNDSGGAAEVFGAPRPRAKRAKMPIILRAARCALLAGGGATPNALQPRPKSTSTCIPHLPSQI